jgi:hypothetical protein
MVDCGEVVAPEMCNYKKRDARLTAYDYSDEAGSLDLFYFDPADTLVGKVNNNRVERGFNYLMKFFNESSRALLLRNADGAIINCDAPDVMELVRAIKGKINQLRIFFLTDGITDPSAVPATVESEEGDYIIEYNVWDIQRVYQQHNIRAGREKVEIDFLENYNTELQCLKVNDTNPFVNAYLAIIPGVVLAKIYKQYQQVLLEKNVRTFLQFKGRVNKDIRKTLRERPDMFFSYNNGISTTASEIELKSVDGQLLITRIYDWQIVNGGQTTASLAAVLNDKTVDLSKVFVSMKISVIRDKEHINEIVASISNTANSQTAIRRSDFSANDAYLIEIEKYSRSEWVPNGSNKSIYKWYFERTRGQYLDQLAQLNGVNEREFKLEYPKSQKFTKTDVAKYEASWSQKPYDVCLGAEKNYDIFVAETRRAKTIVTSTYYKKLIAKAILFKTIDSIIRSKDLGGFKSNMVAYVMSSISLLSDSSLDLLYIWEHQKVQDEVVNKIEALIPIIWDHLMEASDANTWSKKSSCWDELLPKLAGIDKFNDALIETNVVGIDSLLSASDQEIFNKAESYSSQFWFSLAKWAAANKMLAPTDRKLAYNYGSIRSKGKPFSSLKQAKNALKVAELAKEKGFKE